MQLKFICKPQMVRITGQGNVRYSLFGSGRVARSSATVCGILIGIHILPCSQKSFPDLTVNLAHLLPVTLVLQKVNIPIKQNVYMVSTVTALNSHKGRGWRLLISRLLVSYLLGVSVLSGHVSKQATAPMQTDTHITLHKHVYTRLPGFDSVK